jgi:hypothetical protein
MLFLEKNAFVRYNCYLFQSILDEGYFSLVLYIEEVQNN